VEGVGERGTWLSVRLAALPPAPSSAVVEAPVPEL
jgi:hypothetical protein